VTGLLSLTGGETLLLTLIVIVAGIVRGFSGFALSALVMASAVVILPPVELIPICLILELAASLLMARGGWQEADRGTVLGLVIGSTIGVPIGLAFTTTLPIETSKAIALIIIVVLAIMQLAKIRLSFLATKPGLYGAGLTAGIATGLASVGGMVVALYVLSQDTKAAKMRAALVLFLFISSLTTLISQLLFGVMDLTAFKRGLIMAVPALVGVKIGQMMFVPRLERFYRPFCLTLLTGLAVASLIRTSMT